MESAEPGARSGPLRLCLLGAFTLRRGDAPLPLPASRKLRALIAYLALAPQARLRAHLCELLWEVPNDPRGELRWCLSKARRLLDEPCRRRVITEHDTVRLDLNGCAVDVHEVAKGMQEGIERLSVDRLRDLLALFAGDFLQGLEIGRSPFFTNWLTAQRRRLRACQAALLEQQVRRLPVGADDAFSALDAWLHLAPFDPQAHTLMLNALASRQRWREGEEHLAAAAGAFQAEGLDCRPLRDVWRTLRTPAAREVPTKAVAAAAGPPCPPPPSMARGARASIAVMPFAPGARSDAGRARTRGGLADGLAHDIIARLAKLRSLFVIAQGTVFALDQRDVGPEEAGRRLNVDYVVSGTLRYEGERLIVEVELVQARTARIVWIEAFEHQRADALVALDDIGNRIVASVEIEIEAAERNQAILKPPASLDAWEAHHRGLWHMYRFNQADNLQARHYFEMSRRLDPTFSRAYAGLSFTHWQDAFQRWAEPSTAADLAFETAGQSLIVDDRDPAAHWAMGRALWLRGSAEQSLAALRSAVTLSPNFALGHYALGFVHCQTGDAQVAIEAADHSRDLSPYDPLLFGMLAVRALALLRLGRTDEAADWALKAAARPNAHVHILAIAAHCLAMAGRPDEARRFRDAIRAVQPAYRAQDLLSAFRLDEDTQAAFRAAGKRLGLE
ncbi:transcriptional regulator [Pseudomonadota bacterium AL_CKDN230030165-1A_HGKHYDSX7]